MIHRLLKISPLDMQQLPDGLSRDLSLKDRGGCKLRAIIMHNGHQGQNNRVIMIFEEEKNRRSTHTKKPSACLPVCW